jgi:hypothetical protein
MDGQVECSGCGARVKDLPGQPHKYIGANAGCWEVYGEILAKEYGEYRYPELTHRLTSDTYAVQHPGTPERRSIQSVNGHLVSLYLVLEKGLTGRQATDALGRVIKRAAEFTWLTPPSPNGTVTVLDVVKAKDLPEHERLVRKWAEDVWKAWRGHHARIRELVAKYSV